MSAASTVFFSIFITGGKFVFREEKLLLCPGFSILVKRYVITD
jgi:hypothetical protein